MKNNKGFTLIELLAVIVVLGVVMAIVIRSVFVSMGNAKKETEKVFVSKIEDAIEQYIDLNKSEFNVDNMATLNQLDKVSSSDGQTKPVNMYQLKKSSGEDFTFEDIINDESKFIKESDLVNPANEDVECNINTVINIYRDTDFVYYFETELSCISAENKINTLPEGYSPK